MDISWNNTTTLSLHRFVSLLHKKKKKIKDLWVLIKASAIEIGFVVLLIYNKSTSQYSGNLSLLLFEFMSLWVFNTSKERRYTSIVSI